MFYLTTHSTHFIYGYIASDMVKDHSDSEKGNPINSKGYTSRASLAGTRNSSMGPPHEGSIRRPIAPRANALTTGATKAVVYTFVICNSNISSSIIKVVRNYVRWHKIVLMCSVGLSFRLMLGPLSLNHTKCVRSESASQSGNSARHQKKLQHWVGHGQKLIYRINK